MSEKFIRIYKKLDFNEIKQSLLIYGDLSASCANCQALDIKLGADSCPSCQARFNYIAFRNVKSHLPKMLKIAEEKPYITFVDFDDYKKISGAIKAEDFLK